MTACSRCKRVTGHYWLVDHQELCDDCYPLGAVSKGFNKRDTIKSRVVMPDGKVIQGREGQRILDSRLRSQSSVT